MSNDPLLSPDVSAGLRDEPEQKPAPLARDLLDLVATIKWIEGEAAANRVPARDGVAAIERIEDIAVALRERQVEAPLCDALEAATRKVAQSITHGEAVAERVLSAFRLLHALAERIAAADAAMAPVPTAAEAAEPTAATAAHTGAAPRVDRGSDASTDAAPTGAIPRPASVDSLAALPALSEEELIALFS
jgi:hypothetical protein